jgi:hypothetical protein
MDRSPFASSSGIFMSTHDALIEARLEDQHAHAHAAHPAQDEAPHGSPNRALAGQSALRVRVGRHLVALGAAVAGEDERTQADRAA